MNPNEEFRAQVRENIEGLANDPEAKALTNAWIRGISSHGYPYNFEWMGRPIIQVPQDMVAMQEIIWQVKPDLIIETGIAHGGSLILNASMLALLDMCDAIETGSSFDPAMSRRKVLGVDIDIRAHNREAIEAHPMASRIQMIQGSSIAPETIKQVRDAAAGYQKVLISLDSNGVPLNYHRVEDTADGIDTGTVVRAADFGAAVAMAALRAEAGPIAGATP